MIVTTYLDLFFHSLIYQADMLLLCALFKSNIITQILQHKSSCERGLLCNNKRSTYKIRLPIVRGPLFGEFS